MLTNDIEVLKKGIIERQNSFYKHIKFLDRTYLENKKQDINIDTITRTLTLTEAPENGEGYVVLYTDKIYVTAPMSRENKSNIDVIYVSPTHALILLKEGELGFEYKGQKYVVINSKEGVTYKKLSPVEPFVEKPVSYFYEVAKTPILESIQEETGEVWVTDTDYTVEFDTETYSVFDDTSYDTGFTVEELVSSIYMSFRLYSTLSCMLDDNGEIDPDNPPTLVVEIEDTYEDSDMEFKDRFVLVERQNGFELGQEEEDLEDEDLSDDDWD